MKLWNLRPNPYLRQYISRYWVWENELDLPQIFPGTGTELMFHYQEPFVGSDQNKQVFITPHCHIIAPRYGCYQLQPGKGSGFISVRFRAGAFRHFCKEASSDLLDSFIDISQIWGTEGEEFGQRVLRAKNIGERISIIEYFLMKFLALYGRPTSWLDMAVEKVFYGCGTLALQDISRELFISDRQLQRKFKEAVGVGPKTFQRISRFETVLKQLLLHKQKDYLSTALEYGYYDQAHFIKEFKTYTGEYPSMFLQEEKFMSHFYNEKLVD